jgi:hypothetical protein
MAGAAVIDSNVPIGVSATFSIFSEGRLVSEARVLDSPELDIVTIPVDSTGDSRVGIALFNRGNSNADITLRLFDASSRLVASTSRTLNAKFHESRFVDELFVGVPANFSGALLISSTTPIAAAALKMAGF